MTNAERRSFYIRLISLCEAKNNCIERKKVSKEAGDKVFNEFKDIDFESALNKADEAGWIHSDELDLQIASYEQETELILAQLKANQYKLNEFQSCCAYGISDKKPVKVTFLDGRELRGLMYPYVYDNAQEMYLLDSDGFETDLDRGWEVLKVEFE